MSLPVEKKSSSRGELSKKDLLDLSVILLTGDEKGKIYKLSENERIVIGRSHNCTIVINDTKSSREHAEIVFANGSYIITDLKSQNGIIVNQQKTLQTTLNVGDKIVIGQTWLRVIVGESEFKEKSNLQSPLPKKKTNKTVFYILLFLFIFLMFVIPENKVDEYGKRKDSHETIKKFSEVNSDLVKKIATLQKEGDKELQRNIDTIIKRGMRELREKNYYRATLEFTHALDLSPKDSQASFYLRRTFDELDQVVKELNLAAMRDIESLHYQRAVISYCAIMRLLYNFKQDKRYKDTIERIHEVEMKMGKEKGETSCY